MSLVGKTVCNIYGSLFRYGIVTEEKTVNKWKYCTVEWIGDEVYKESMEWLANLRNGEDHTRHTYRIDQLRFIDVDEQLDRLKKLKRVLKKSKKVEFQNTAGAGW